MLVDVGFVVDAAEAEVGNLDAQLFTDFATNRLFHRFLRLPPAAREFPAAPPVAVPHQKHATISIENDGRRAEPRSPADQVVVDAAERAQKDAWDLHPLSPSGRLRRDYSRGGRVTAPSLADETSAAYFAKTPSG